MNPQAGKSLGKFGEDYAHEVLLKKGHKILARNFHSRYGEIDIISEKDGIIYFFEVKTRRTTSLNYPEESITYRKKQKMLQTAERFIENAPDAQHKTWRFFLFGILLEGQKIKKIECLPIFS
jgi:putative endonuclease